MNNCYYSAQGELICQKEPIYIDSTGIMLKKPHTTVSWSNNILEKTAACLSDMPCCVADENNIINKTIFCKPEWCCNKN
jgi:hypothetical protein